MPDVRATPRILPMNPGAGYAAHRAEVDEAIRRVLEGGRYILGPEVAAFEQEFARYIGVRHAIGVGSGTEALHVALRACGVGPGDRVATVSHTAVATVTAIELAGASPLWIDIDPDRFTIDPASLDAAIREQGGTVKAVVPVHLYGHPADMTALTEVADRHGLAVIEDCAQAHGATWGGRRTGSFGRAAAFSFYPTKNLGAFGDAGAVLTDDPDVAERAERLRQYGWKDRYVSEGPGWNTRLDEIQAAVLRVKLRHLDPENSRRRAIAGVYDRALAGTSLGLPRVAPGATHVYHQYVIRTPQRDELREALTRQGAPVLIHYPVPAHLQPAYEGRSGAGARELPQTERACREILSLPMHPHLTDAEVAAVAGWIAAWDGEGAARSRNPGRPPRAPGGGPSARA